MMKRYSPDYDTMWQSINTTATFMCCHWGMCVAPRGLLYEVDAFQPGAVGTSTGPDEIRCLSGTTDRCHSSYVSTWITITTAISNINNAKRQVQSIAAKAKALQRPPIQEDSQCITGIIVWTLCEHWLPTRDRHRVRKVDGWFVKEVVVPRDWPSQDYQSFAKYNNHLCRCSINYCIDRSYNIEAKNNQRAGRTRPFLQWPECGLPTDPSIRTRSDKK